MKKTVLEWYNTFPEPYRSQAIENTKKDELDFLRKKPYPYFYWEASPQGYKYWNNFYQTFKTNTMTNEPTTTKPLYINGEPLKNIHALIDEKTVINFSDNFTAKIDGNQITFEPVKPKYPTWENAEREVLELWDSVGGMEEVYTTLNRIQWLRNEWNRIDGFVVDWEDLSQAKYFIAHNQNEPFIDYCYHDHHFLHFQSEPTAQLFLDTFRDKIEVAKEFIN